MKLKLKKKINKKKAWIYPIIGKKKKTHEVLRYFSTSFYILKSLQDSSLLEIIIY